MSWWDYGYQITAMANRTILVDNNTWNNTHISRVGQVCWTSTTEMFLKQLCQSYLGPVVQSICCLTSSLRGQVLNSLSVLHLYN